MPSPAPLTPPLAREPSLEDLLLAQAGAACQGSELKQIQIKYRLKTVNLQCHILQDGDTFWERGGMGQFLGQRYWKKDYLLSSNWKEIKKPFDITKIMGIILHLLHQLQYWPGSAISYKDSAYILQLEFWFIAWLFHAWTIAIMFVPSSFFFFYPHTTRLFRASVLALFLTEVSLLFTYFFPHCYSPICVQLHIKSRLERQCITAIIQEPQKQQTPTFWVFSSPFAELESQLLPKYSIFLLRA